MGDTEFDSVDDTHTEMVLDKVPDTVEEREAVVVTDGVLVPPILREGVLLTVLLMLFVFTADEDTESVDVTDAVVESVDDTETDEHADVVVENVADPEKEGE